MTRLAGFLFPWRRQRLAPVRIEGACRMTGNCCRNLILVDRGRPVKTPRQFRRLQRKEPSYAMFEPNQGSSRDGWMRFHCSNLTKDNRCGIYATRPDMCRDYPQPEMFEKGGSLLPGCGYKLVPVRVAQRSFDRVLADAMRGAGPEGSEAPEEYRTK